MSTRRTPIACTTAVAAVALVAGCASTRVSNATNARTPVTSERESSEPPQSQRAELSVNARQLCEKALGSRDLLSWASTTVAQFRAYQYGGPTPTVPLAHVFPDLPSDAPGAWCATGEGTPATHWWAVVAGRPAASLIIISGPAEGVQRGPLSGPPQIP